MPTTRLISITGRFPTQPRQRAMPRRLLNIPPTVQLIREIEAQNGPIRVVGQHPLGYQIAASYNGNHLVARLNSDGEPVANNDRDILFNALRETNPRAARGRYNTLRGILNSWLK